MSKNGNEPWVWSDRAYASRKTAAQDALRLGPDIDTYSAGLQVIGAGFGRTGTLSLKAALSIIYGAPVYHMADNIRGGHSGFWLEAHSEGKTPEQWRQFYQCYAASVDVPTCLFHNEIQQAYPDAKVVLSVRSDAEAWHSSCENTIFVMQPGNPAQPWGIWLFQHILPFGPGIIWRKMMLAVWDGGFFQGDYSRENTTKIYEDWRRKVIDSVPAGKLLVHNAKEGWGPLCEFLNVPVPDCPYPKVNDTSEFQKVILLCNTVGWALGLGLGLGAATAGWQLFQRYARNTAQ